MGGTTRNAVPERNQGIGILNNEAIAGETGALPRRPVRAEDEKLDAVLFGIPSGEAVRPASAATNDMSDGRVDGGENSRQQSIITERTGTNNCQTEH
jgi:hypothetical protein